MSSPVILFITKGLQASSTRYRVTDFLPYWERAGWNAQHVTHDGSLRCWAAILREAKRADVVVILRRTFRFPFLHLLRAAAQHLVFDFDDAIFVRGSGERSASKQKRFGRTLAACDQVWAGNRYLADNAQRYNRHVTIIPTALHADKYQVMPPKPAQHIDLVWIGSSATRKHLMTIVPALERVATSVPGLRLKIIADFSIDVRGLEVQAIRWSGEREADELASAHIGLAPLPDNPFTRGKCGLKILQYMAAGLPVVASPVGVNADLVEDGVTGYTANDHDQWVRAIERLAADPALCAQMGAKGRERCHAQYTLDRVFEKLSATLSDIHA